MSVIKKGKNPLYITLFNKTMKLFIRGAAACRLYWPFAYIYSKLFLQRIKPEHGETDPLKPNILAIKPHYFVRDLEILADTREFNILKIPSKWQSMILRVYWEDNAWIDGEKSYYQPVKPEIIEYQKRLRGFLKKFLKAFYKINKIDCVIASNVTYKDCYDWGLVTKEIGVPFIVLQRENLFACKGLMNWWRNIIGNWLGRFHGSNVVFHNSKVKELYLSTGYATEDQLAVLGCLRMDKYLRRLKEYDFSSGKKYNRAALFSFHHIANLETMYKEYFNPEIGWAKLFHNVHMTFARTAIANPDKEFIIKPRYTKVFTAHIRNVLEKEGLCLKDIPNLIIDAELNPHDIILTSDVVCAFGSTVILESGIARKPVIVPYFDEALRPEYQDFILLKDYFRYFDIATSPEDLQKKIEYRFTNNLVSEDYYNKMKELFEQYVSSFDANSTDKYVKYIGDRIKEAKCKFI